MQSCRSSADVRVAPARDRVLHQRCDAADATLTSLMEKHVTRPAHEDHVTASHMCCTADLTSSQYLLEESGVWKHVETLQSVPENRRRAETTFTFRAELNNDYRVL